MPVAQFEEPKNITFFFSLEIIELVTFNWQAESL